MFQKPCLAHVVSRVRVVGRIVRQRLTCVSLATRESRPWSHSILSKAPTDVPTRRPRIRKKSRSCSLTLPRLLHIKKKPTLVAFQTSRPKNDTLIVISIGSDIARVKGLVRLVSRVATPVLAESTRFVPSHITFSSTFPRSLQSPFPNGSTGNCRRASSTQQVVGDEKTHTANVKPMNESCMNGCPFRCPSSPSTIQLAANGHAKKFEAS